MTQAVTANRAAEAKVKLPRTCAPYRGFASGSSLYTVIRERLDAVGVTDVQGTFESGAIVDVMHGTDVFARGLVRSGADRGPHVRGSSPHPGPIGAGIGAGIGPASVARFLQHGLDDEIQADVAGLVRELLRLL